MATLALNIDMRGMAAVVIGGGAVALRKVTSLRACGALVRVVAPEICPDIAALQEAGGITVRTGRYVESDLDGSCLVVAATDSAAVNSRVCADARRRGVLVAVADDPSAGNCTFPATLQRGDLEIAVSTGGRCPTFAVDVRNRIGEIIGPEYAQVLDAVAAEREKLLTNGNDSTYNAQVLRSLAKRLLAGLTAHKDHTP